MYDDLELLQPYKSIIYHDLYGNGRYIKKSGSIVYVKFDNQEDNIILNVKDFNRSWIIKNLTGFQFEGTKVYDITDKFEHEHLAEVVEVAAKEKDDIENQLFELPDSNDYSVLGISGPQLSKLKGKLYAKKTQLIDIHNHPYYARIDLVQSNNSDNSISYYIGDRDFGDYVISAYSEEAEPFHNQDFYSSDAAEYKLTLFRDYTIKNRKLIKYDDNLKSDKENISKYSDERLKRIIEYNRSENVKNIIRSIQTNQYRIVSHPQNKNIFVQGCAGSGKTMILAQRLTLHAYRLKDKLDLKDTYIISPTKFMSKEIASFGVDINDSNRMSNFEFNKHIIEYIASELNIDVKVNKTYLTNNLLSKTFIRKTYLKQTLETIHNELDMLIQKDEDDIYELFIEYCDQYKINKLSQILSLKKIIDKELYNDLYDKYHQIIHILSQLTFLEVNEYKTKLESENKEQLAINKEILQIKPLYNKFLKLYKDKLLFFIKSYPEFSYLKNYSLEEIITLFDEINKCYDEDKNEIKNIELYYERYLSFKQTYNLYLKRINQIDKELASISINIVKTRRLKEDKKELERSIKSLKNNFINEIKGYEYVVKIQDFDELTKHWNNYFDIYNQLLKQINELKGTILSLIEIEKKKTIVLEKEKNIDLIKVNETKEYISLLNEILNHRQYLSKETKLNNNISELLNQLNKINIERYKDIFKFIDDYSKFINDKEYIIIEKYINEDIYDEIIILMIEFLIERYKKQNKIDLNKSYEFELFYKMYFLFDKDGVKSMRNKWIFIDEIQDYSYYELRIYERIFKNSVFNYFGDMSQSIHAKGLRSKDLVLITRTFHSFEINENYRNSIEVTEYVNEKLNKNMRPVGLSGSVHECDIEFFFKEVSNTKKYKNTVIIVNDKNKIKELQNKYSKKYNICVIDEETININPENINLFTPLMAKGLEFDTVCVITNGMSDNEKYVSFTRAMTHLFVVND